MLSPTWNEQNAFAAGCDHEGGLTALGEQLIDRLPALGIVIDLAHASPRTFADVLDRAPGGAAFVSHASCRAVYNHRRNLSDAQLKAIAEHGGVVCLMPHPLVVDPGEATIDRFIDHIDHAASVVGVDRVGLGGDFLKQIARATGRGRSLAGRRRRGCDAGRARRVAGRLPAALFEALGRSRLLTARYRGDRRGNPLQARGRPASVNRGTSALAFLR